MISVWLWFLHRITGFLLIFFLLLHILYFHVLENGYSASEIENRLNSTKWKTFYLLFLFSAIYHGSYGMVTIIREYFNKSKVLYIFYFLIFVAILYMLFFGLSFIF